MTASHARSRLLHALACALLVGGLVEAAPQGPREHPRGVWGQDELRRSIRQLENDWDRLVEAWERAEDALKGEESERAAVRQELLAIGSELDDLRDAYTQVSRAETLDVVASLPARHEALFLRIAALDPPRASRQAWDQVDIDLRRLVHEADAVREGRAFWMLDWGNRDRVRVAVAEIEDLSDELKRYLLRTQARMPEAEARVAKPGGRDRHRVHDGRLQAAVLAFEEAADELKALHRATARPRGVRSLVDRLARSARTIDFSMSEASTSDEARREWREIVPELQTLLSAHGLRGIGAGWETHR